MSTAEIPAANAAERQPWSPLKAVLVGGLVAAIGDFIAAMLIWNISWEVVGHAIATGWLGPAVARASGVPGAMLGAASHTGILLAAAALYVVASRRAPILARAPLVFGPLFGFAVYLTMHYVVLPLSLAARPGEQPLELTPLRILDIGSHLLLVGLPIALAASRTRRA
ncbi:MAG: hypothetical protein Q7U20_10215 [Caulobacter sp.]|nr:hypothetical protein [Caulobacter sp.]